MDELRRRLIPAKTSLLVVDVQERLCAAMNQERLARLVNRTQALLDGAKALKLPVLATEQYRKGLGATLTALSERFPPGAPVVEKLRFSAALPEILSRFGDRRQVLVAGMETHVCVFQTVRDLAEKGYVPFLCADAVISRTEEDRRIGLDRCREVGAVLTTTESALFDLLVEAGTPEFKVVSAAVK